jgi:hypothetical protein
MTETAEFETAAAAFFEQMKLARAAGKDWWVDLQIRQIEGHLWQGKKIAALVHALEMVRDADEDCKADGGPPLPIPPLARSTIDRALGMAALPTDPNAVSLSERSDA